MQHSASIEIATAATYLVVALLYAVLWQHRSRSTYAALAVAASILAVCAYLRSGMGMPL